MPRPAVGSFKYQIQDINNSIRRTRTLLMTINGIRNLARDVSDVLKKPTFTNVMWTIIHLIRIYRRMDRLNTLLLAEAARSKKLMGFLIGIGYIPLVILTDLPVGGGEGGGVLVGSIGMRTEAYMNNLPINLDSIRFDGLTEETQSRLQKVFEDDAELTVYDARRILNGKIIDKIRSTRNLEESIGWRPEVDGVKITADAYYADWVEEGHDSFGGHHFMFEAFEMAKPRLDMKVKAELDSLIK
jgi:hypothetical protein